MASAFEAMGLEVEKQELWLYLPHPISGAVSVVTPVELDLSVKERPVEGDPYSDNPDHDIGWNAYAGTGEAIQSIDFGSLPGCFLLLTTELGALFHGSRAAAITSLTAFLI